MPLAIKCLSSTYCCGFRAESVHSNDTEEFWSVLTELQPGRAQLYQHLMSLATVQHAREQGPLILLLGTRKHRLLPTTLFVPFSGSMKIWRRLPPCVHLGAGAL